MLGWKGREMDDHWFVTDLAGFVLGDLVLCIWE